MIMLAAAIVAATGLADQLAAHRSDLSVEEARLAGPGAAVLSTALQGAQFVFLGEDHGMAQVARFAAALHAMLQPRGFDTLALEVGPSAARELATALRASDPLQAHEAFLRDHPMSVAFYNTSEEFEFLRAAAKASGERLRIVGFDQELMGSSRALLESLRDPELPKGLAARIDEMLIAEQDALADAKGSGRLEHLYMMRAPLQDLLDLQAALRRARLDSTPIDDLLASRAVYEEFGRDKYASNVQRSLLMRRSFAAAESAEPGKKTLLKGGGDHAFKGLNPLRNRDLGNYVAELAEGRQQRSVHVLMFAAAGQQLAFAGMGQQMKAHPIRMEGKDSPLPGVGPMIRIAANHPRSWSLFDLRPLRGKLKSDPEVEKVVYGFDFVVVVPRGEAAHEIGVAPQRTASH